MDVFGCPRWPLAVCVVEKIKIKNLPFHSCCEKIIDEKKNKNNNNKEKK